MAISVIAAGLSATKTGFDLIRSAREALGKQGVDPTEIQARLLELQALMLEAQRALGDADDEMRGMRRRIEELEQQQVTAAALVFANDVYWTRDAEDKLVGPYCPTCWDEKKMLVRLNFYKEGQYTSLRPGISKVYECVLHGSKYYLPKDIVGPGDTIK